VPTAEKNLLQIAISKEIANSIVLFNAKHLVEKIELRLLAKHVAKNFKSGKQGLTSTMLDFVA